VARTRSVSLTDAELRLMQVLWDRGAATVGDVVGALKSRPSPAYNTVLTLLRIMERKGYVTHVKAGRAFVYEPVIDRQRAQQGAVRHLLKRFFDDSPRALVLNLLRDEGLDPHEVEALRGLVEDAAEETP